MKKIICAVIVVFIVIGTVMTAITGFNLGLEYTAVKKTTVYIGKTFDLAEVRELTKDVFGDGKVEFQKMRPFEDVLAITTTEITDEQIEKINELLNEKYELENTRDSFEISDIPSANLLDDIRPYVGCIGIFVIFVIAYETIIYRKLGALKVGLETFATILVAVLGLFSAIEICGLTINTYIVAEVLAVLFIAVGGLTVFFENRMQKTKQVEEEEKENKKKK